MSRSTPASLIVLGVVGVVAATLVQAGLAAMSLPKLRPELSLGVTLVLVAAAVVALAVPVRRATRGNPQHRVDPFYATRVVVLAKATTLAGALFTGFGLGLVIELFLRASGPGFDAYLRVLSVFGGGVVLLAGALIAELLCVVPPADDEDPDGGTGAPAAG